MPDDRTPSRRALLAGVAALPVLGASALAAAPNPDAELLRLCTAWRTNMAEADRLMEAAEEAPKAESDRLFGMACAAAPEARAIRARILTTPARTRAGFEAKGAIVAEHIENLDAEAMRMVQDLVRDALALPGGAA